MSNHDVAMFLLQTVVVWIFDALFRNKKTKNARIISCNDADFVQFEFDDEIARANARHRDDELQRVVVANVVDWI